jgi:hypothetical protein
MDVPAGTILLGDNAYLFRSPSTNVVTDCFIIAHGGTPAVKDTRFTVPAGCTVNFFTRPERTLQLGSGPIAGFTAMAGRHGGNPRPIDAENRFAAGASCRDYILAKAVGKHFKAAPSENTYVGINAALNALAGPHAGLQWMPHYISIRDRTSWFCDTNVWLSKVIELTRAYDARIVNFYCAHCRSVLRGADETKNLKTVGAQGLR